MDRNELSSIISALCCELEGNTVNYTDPADGIEKELTLYEEPIFGISDATDPLYATFRDEDIIGPWYVPPAEWLQGAKSVISLFFPASEKVRATNAQSADTASVEWSYARMEGQKYINGFMEELKKKLEEKGIRCVYPSGDPSFFSIVGGRGSGSAPRDPDTGLYPGADSTTFGSCWSERHAAFVSGLGTFGMSRGLITRKGMAGRYGSLITDAALEADRRDYTDPYEYCIKCGACAKRCPAGAIPENGPKDHTICSPWVSASGKKLAPRYGCGLCQTGVPCEHTIPKKS